MSSEPRQEQPIALPELREALLDRDAVAELLRDIGWLGQLLEIRSKGGPTCHADAAPLDLETARRMLLEREVSAIQVVYRYLGKEWIDTLMNGPSGVRLVRMQATSPSTEC